MDGVGARVWSRQGKDLTAGFPDLVAAAEAQLPDGVIVEGEAVVWSGDRLDFDQLLRRNSSRGQKLQRLVETHPASFVASDVLAVAWQDARSLPFDARRQLLEELAADWAPPFNLSPVTNDIGTARD